MSKLTMSKLTFSVTQLRAALLCAAKGDIRYYLNGVYVECNGPTTRMCATTGHLLLAIDYNHGDPDGGYTGNFILPREVCEMIAKAKTTRNYDYGTIEITEEHNKDALNAVYRTVSGMVRVQDTCLVFKSVEGVFPQYSRVITPWVGDDTNMTAGQYNPEYIGIFSKVAKLFGSKLGLFTLWQRGLDSALVNFSSLPDCMTAIGVLMPVSMGKRGEALNVPRTGPFQSCLPAQQEDSAQSVNAGA